MHNALKNKCDRLFSKRRRLGLLLDGLRLSVEHCVDMAKAKRSPGRPRTRETKLSRWIDSSGKTRDQIAKELGINRTHLDMLCRGARRPSLALAVGIEKLTRGAIPPSEWLTGRGVSF
jgi:hypothetical protein